MAMPDSIFAHLSWQYENSSEIQHILLSIQHRLVKNSSLMARLK